MTDFKGFGSRRSVEIIPLRGTERDDVAEGSGLGS